MAGSFFFYDLETSGFSPREARIMQFAGQRTDLKLRPIGEPLNTLIKLTPDILPDPDAILVTGITPQSTITDGLSEAVFLKQFTQEAAKPDTIFVGYNSVRFDDEFMRFTLWRNFYDAYEWQWKNGRSRWDLLDVVRMTRALRPEGITWPFGTDGRPSNRLEFLTSVNSIDHQDAHDALADVRATIAVANLVQTHQPKLFTYLLSMRDKRSVAKLVTSNEPFIYTSGKFPSEFEKTTVVIMLAEQPNKQGALVYDLRHNPEEFAELTPLQLADRWKFTRDENALARLPVKTLQFNRCPAIAPLSTLDAESQTRLQLDMDAVELNRQKVLASPDFAVRLLEALEILDKKRQSELLVSEHSVDTQLYDGFVSDSDKTVMQAVRAAEPRELTELLPSIRDKRLQALLPLYKARNYPESLSTDEHAAWDNFCSLRLVSGGSDSRLSKYFERLRALSGESRLSQKQRYIVEELRLYGESIMPLDDEL